MLNSLSNALRRKLKISRGVAALLTILVAGSVFISWKGTSPSQDNLYWLIKRSRQTILQYKKLTEATFVGRDQEDPLLVAYIQDHEMHQPSSLPYNLSNPERKHFSQYRQSLFADTNFLHGMTGGFFLEAGAMDGEDKSNSLYFEKYKGWNGLLVEPDPKLFRHLASLNRKAYAINAGLSLNNKSDTATFVPQRGVGQIRNNAKNGITIRTFPLYSMLLALGVSQVDFFSLDIEGAENSVLLTIPWDKIKFRLICMEINKYGGGRSAYVKFFEDRGYIFLGLDYIDAWFGLKELLQETMDVDAWLLKMQKKN